MIRRALDLAGSLCGLVILSPLFALAAIAVKLSSPGPVIYRARRSGRHGREFRLLKFRSMRTDVPGAAITRAGDPRVTTVGRWLRKTKVDELPQLVNVLRGEMSLVGPRPEDPRYVASYDAEQRRILDVKPGITSAASLRYRSEEESLAGEEWERLYVEEIMPEKLRIDLAYEQQRTLASDLRLIARTIAAVLKR